MRQVKPIPPVSVWHTYMSMSNLPVIHGQVGSHCGDWTHGNFNSYTLVVVWHYGNLPMAGRWGGSSRNLADGWLVRGVDCANGSIVLTARPVG